MRWPVLVLAAASGCSQLFGLEAPTGGDQVHDALGDGISDSPVDAVAPSTCVQKWLSASGPSFGTIAAMSTINSTSSDYGAFVAADGLEMEWARAGEPYMATRQTTSQSFSGVNHISSLSSGSSEGKLWVSSTKLRGFFASARGSGAGGMDIFRAFRTSTSVSFNVDQAYLENVNTTANELDPHLTEDLLHMYFTVAFGGMNRIAFTSRATINDSFATPVLISELTSNMADFGPTLTADERIIVFASSRGGNPDLWYATRASASAPFGAPVLVPSLNTPSFDESPHLSPDGCHLYFSSDRATPNVLDIFETTIQ